METETGRLPKVMQFISVFSYSPNSCSKYGRKSQVWESGRKEGEILPLSMSQN